MDEKLIKLVLDWIASVGAPTALAVGGMFLLYLQNKVQQKQTEILSSMNEKVDTIETITTEVRQGVGKLIARKETH